MKYKVLILLSLITLSNAATSVIDFLPSSQLKDDAAKYPSDGASYDGTKATGCFKQAFDGSCRDSSDAKVACNCPAGTQCIEADTTAGSLNVVNTCKAITKVVHQGAGGADFEAANVISQPTQVSWLGFSTEAKDESDASADGGAGSEDKFSLYRVHVDGVVQGKFTSCQVTLSGSLVTATNSESDKPLVDNGLLSTDTANYKTDGTGTLAKPTGAGINRVTCEFRLHNKGYLGSINLHVQFNKIATLLDIGEKQETIVELHTTFVPDDSDSNWHDPSHENWASFGSGATGLFPDHTLAATASDRYKSVDGVASTSASKSNAVFQFADATSGDYQYGFKVASATATKGTVSLPIKGTFFDKRYKIADQTGVEALRSGVGDGAMRKEGLDIHYDFKDFYVAANNAFDNGGVNMNPVALYSAYLASTDLGTNLVGYAQYSMEHTYTFTYGGPLSNGKEMAHFKPEYLSCPLCDARIVFKAFEKDSAYSSLGATDTESERKDYLVRYYGSISDVSKLPSSSNSITLDDVDVDVVTGQDGMVIKQDTTTSVALRLPTAKDPQNPDGHALGEFFSVKKSGTTDYNSLTANYMILDERLKVVDTDGNDVSNAMVECGSGFGTGPLYKLGSDIVAKAQELFDDTCRIVIPTTGFGTKITLQYDAGVKAAGDSFSATPTEAEIIETDERKIMAGNTELSILRRKVDTSASISASSVTFQLSKTGVTGALTFKLKGSNTMIGFGNDGSECTEDMVCNAKGKAAPANPGEACGADLDPDNVPADATTVASGKQCKGVHDSALNAIVTSATDGVSVPVSIRSSSDCFLYMDVELQDTTADFATYALRLPCVRTTDSLQDDLSLSFGFSTTYSLSSNTITAEIDYDLGTSAEAFGLALVTNGYGFGQCSGSGTVAAPSNDGSVACSILASDWTDTAPADQAASGVGKLELEEDKTKNLGDLKKCDDALAGIPDTDSYQIDHHLALVYERDVSSMGGRTTKETYCQDQKFITTIKRDATASVTVATLVSPTLERSVVVTDIDWVSCAASLAECKGSSDCYKLKIQVSSREKDKSSSTWEDSQLKDVLAPVGTHDNTDDMTIVHSLTAASTGSVFALESGCGVVQSCSDSTGTHYGDLTAGTKQDVIIRGNFEGADVDTDVEIETKFSTCPLDSVTTDGGGELMVGLKLDCEAYDTDSTTFTTDGSGAKSTRDSHVSTGSGCSGILDANDGTCTTSADATACRADPLCVVGALTQNCATAFASSKAVVSADIFLDYRDDAGATNAGAWTFKDIDYIINRYEPNLLGEKDASKKISSDLMMEIRYNSGTYDCTKKKAGLTGLPTTFDANVLTCPAATGNAEADIDGIEFDLQPLQSANMDIFEVEVIAVLRNNALETRRLRAVYTLGADGQIDTLSSGLQVIEASKEISDELIYEDPKNASQHIANNTEKAAANTETIIIMIAVIVGIIGLILLLRAGLGCMAAGGAGAAKAVAGLDPNGETSSLLKQAGRSTKFSNLRY